MRPTKLGIGCDEITSDGLYTLVEGEYMVNNHKMFSFMTEEAIEKKLAELQ